MKSQQYLANPPAWHGLPRVDAFLTRSKDDFLEAEVGSIVDAGVKLNDLQAVAMRPPFECHARFVIFDASRLPAP
jgi:hypothetical protein